MKLLRMMQWVVLAAIMYAIAIMAPVDWPQVQTVAFKLGNVLIAGYIGYWLFEMSAKHMPDTAFDQLAQSLLIGLCVIAVSLGL